MKKRKAKVIIVALIMLVLVTTSVFLYVNDYYHSEVDLADYEKSSGKVSITEVEQGLFLDGPGIDNAVIFYPGAKVEYTSYLSIFYKLAEEGIDCFLIKMPCNLAIFGQNSADKIMENYDYSHWYLSGHSLGGAMAASYASKHLEKLDGLVLLAAYPTKSLKKSDFLVLSLYGSEDGVLNLEKLEIGRDYMPKQYKEICIKGGNHANFGNYGDQKGDNSATISREEQQNQTVKEILKGIIDKRMVEK